MACWAGGFFGREEKSSRPMDVGTPRRPNTNLKLCFPKSYNDKENGNYYSIIGYILGLCRDNGKQNGNYYSI